MDDQTFAVRVIRFAVTAAGAYFTATGLLDPTVGSILTGSGLLLGSGEANATPSVPAAPTK